MEWPSDMDLSIMNVAAAPYGGPLAIVRNAKEFVKVGGASMKPTINIFTASGQLKSSIHVNRIELSLCHIEYFKCLGSGTAEIF